LGPTESANTIEYVSGAFAGSWGRPSNFNSAGTKKVRVHLKKSKCLGTCFGKKETTVQRGVVQKTKTKSTMLGKDSTCSFFFVLIFFSTTRNPKEEILVCIWWTFFCAKKEGGPHLEGVNETTMGPGETDFGFLGVVPTPHSPHPGRKLQTNNPPCGKQTNQKKKTMFSPQKRGQSRAVPPPQRGGTPRGKKTKEEHPKNNKHPRAYSKNVSPIKKCWGQCQ